MTTDRDIRDELAALAARVQVLEIAHEPEWMGKRMGNALPDAWRLEGTGKAPAHSRRS